MTSDVWGALAIVVGVPWLSWVYFGRDIYMELHRIADTLEEELRRKQ